MFNSIRKYPTQEALKETFRLKEVISDKIETLLENGNIIALFASYGIVVKEKRNDYVALCFNHQERTPSLVISRQHHVAKCFGCGY